MFILGYKKFRLLKLLGDQCCLALALTQRPPLTQLPPRADFGSSSIFSTVLEQVTSSNFRTTDISATLASRRANLMARQARGPWPKPKKVYLEKKPGVSAIKHF